MTTKTFAVAGTSNLHGVIKARFAKDMMRVKVLDAGGHTDINLVELPTAMTKADAASHLIDINFDAGNAAVRAALYAEIDRAAGVKTPKAAVVAAAAEEELQTVDEDAAADDTVTEVGADIIERAHEIADAMQMPAERELSMTPAAIRKREARAAAKQTTPNSEAFQAWAAAANAEEAAEEAAVEEVEEDIQF